MSLLDEIARLLHPGHQLNTNTPVGGTRHAPLTPEQLRSANTQVAFDGARMYQAAHPGQIYTPGQNGETYEGGIDPIQFRHMLMMAPPIKPPSMLRR